MIESIVLSINVFVFGITSVYLTGNTKGVLAIGRSILLALTTANAILLYRSLA